MFRSLTLRLALLGGMAVLVLACGVTNRVDRAINGRNNQSAENDASPEAELPAWNLSPASLTPHANLSASCSAVEPINVSRLSETGPRMDRVEVTNASERNAVCNDGTAAVYYIRPGVDDGRDRWVILLGGGGYCYDEASCAQRVTGSPNLVTARTNGGRPGAGVQSADSRANPDFYNATHVYVHYCSSDLWVGDRTASAATGDLHFRGSTILRSVIEDLETGAGLDAPSLSDATDVLFVGSSAGGLGVMNHADWLSERLAPAPVCAINDGGWLTDVDPYNDAISIPDTLASAYAHWDAQVDADCAAANADGSQCLLTAPLASALETPLFIQVDQTDPTMLSAMGVSRQASGRADLYRAAYGEYIAAEASRFPAVFSAAAEQHEYVQNDALWDTTLSGVTLRVAVGNWYFARDAATQVIAGGAR